MAHQNKIYNKKIVFNNILLTKQNALPESLFQQCCFTFLIVMAQKYYLTDRRQHHPIRHW